MAEHAKGPFLTRLGIRYLLWLARRSGPVVADDEVHILNEREQARLLRIERGVTIRAALAGTFSAIACALTTLFTFDWLGQAPEKAGWPEILKHYSAVYGVTIIATALELGFLYWDGLRSVHRLSVAAGIDLGSGHEAEMVLTSLANAALEIPNNPEHPYIDPRRETPRWRLLTITLLYKAKVTVTNFLAKVIVTRIGGRIVARAWLDFVAVPVTAAWDAWVSFQVIREARIRAMGPSMIQQYLKALLGKEKFFRPELKRSLLMAVGAAVVRTSDLHPNLQFLLKDLLNFTGIPEAERIDESLLFLDSLNYLDPSEQKMVLRVLVLACVIDGKIARREEKLWEEACSQTGNKDAIPLANEFLHHFRKGKSIPDAMWKVL